MSARAVSMMLHETAARLDLAATEMLPACGVHVSAVASALPIRLLAVVRRSAKHFQLAESLTGQDYRSHFVIASRFGPRFWFFSRPTIAASSAAWVVNIRPFSSRNGMCALR